jgi:DeoR family transcriptional regulator of aga operon
MERANSTIVTADYSKIGKEGFTYISDVQQMNTLVTDPQADPRVIERLQDVGVRVIVAQDRTV